MTARERAEIIVGMAKQMQDRAAFVFTYDDWIIAATKHIEEAEAEARKACAEEEREACIKIMEEEARKHSAYSGGLEIFGVNQEGMTALKMIQAIRARSSANTDS